MFAVVTCVRAGVHSNSQSHVIAWAMDLGKNALAIRVGLMPRKWYVFPSATMIGKNRQLVTMSLGQNALAILVYPSLGGYLLRSFGSSLSVESTNSTKMTSVFPSTLEPTLVIFHTQPAYLWLAEVHSNIGTFFVKLYATSSQIISQTQPAYLWLAEVHKNISTFGLNCMQRRQYCIYKMLPSYGICPHNW